MTVHEQRLHSRRLTIRLDVQRFLPPFILAGYGIFILSLFARGVMSWYISPSYVAPTTLAGAVLVGLGAVGLTRRQRSVCSHGCCDDGSCGCAEPSPRLWTYALLCVPLLLALLFPPRSLAAFSANQRGPQIAGLTSVRGAATLRRVSLSINTASFGMEDWVGALSADPNPHDYLGKPVIVSGLFLHDPASAPPGYVMVLRYLVWCCVADARPVGLIVKDTTNGAIHDNQWVTVRGKMGMTTYQGQQIAVVEPTQIKPTASQSPYIY
jgi:uncharacterized repeat protein (TIGR03943 family)